MAKKPKKIHWISDNNGCEFSFRQYGDIVRTETKSEVTCNICKALLNNEPWAEKYRFAGHVITKNFEYENKLDGQLRCYKTTDWEKKDYIHVSIYDAYAGFNRGKWITFYDIKGDEYELIKNKTDEDIIEYAKQKKTIKQI